MTSNSGWSRWLLTLIRALLIVAVSGIRLYHENKYFSLQGKIGGFVLQLIAGIGKLRVADATARALAVWSRQFSTQKRNFLASQRTANALGVFETAYPLIATLIIFAAATFLKSKLLPDVGGFLAFFSAFGQSMGSIGALASGISESLIAIPHITRLRPLISGEAELSDDRKSPGELSGAVELSRVTFRYAASGPPVLENVSLRIAQGEYVAIVGPSGSGKSSLFRLLLGFEKPESGTVFLDGKAIDTLDISAVRRQLGVVLQNGKLATGSVYDNICGGVQLPLEYAWEAARLAGLDEDIKAMPMGMNTVVAEGVNTLSGGQRQRIMIARAVARRPRILLVRRGDERARQPVAGHRQPLARQPQCDPDHHRAPALDRAPGRSHHRAGRRQGGADRKLCGAQQHAGDVCFVRAATTALERFQAKWMPVRVKKTRQTKDRAPFRSHRNGKGSSEMDHIASRFFAT